MKLKAIMNTKLFAMFAAILMLSTLAMPVVAQTVEEWQSKEYEIDAEDSGERLVATYGGYNIHHLILGHYGPISSWATLGNASVDIFFTDEEAMGVIILGDEKYEVKLDKVDVNLVADGICITHKSIEDGILFEGEILNHDGEVRLIRYQDVVVGEIDLGEIVYRFDVAGSLLSAGTILIQHNDEYIEKLFEMGILQLPEMPQLAPPVEPDEDDLHKIDYKPEFICPETHYVPSLKELLAAGDNDIPLLLFTEPHRVEELRKLSELNEDVLMIVAAYTLGHIEEEKDIEDTIELLEGVVSTGDNNKYLEELEQLIGPIGGNPSSQRHVSVPEELEQLIRPISGNPSSQRHVSVRAIADEEYRDRYGALWRNLMSNRIEAADDPFVREFDINFWVRSNRTWDSNDGYTTLSALFGEVMREVGHGNANVRVSFTAQSTPDCGALGMADKLLGDDAITKHHTHSNHILQHEFSHLFNCTCYPTADYHPWYCIMGKWWWVTTGWCSECISDITTNKWRTF